MHEVLRSLQALLQHPVLLASLAVISLVTFVASLLGVPFFLARLPADYFSRSEKKALGFEPSNRPLRTLLAVGKNALGALLVVLGVLMLVLPGQGILTLLVGLLLLDFPGKRRLERRLVGTPRVLRVVNALRKRWNRPPLEL
ncbi:MAG TPA: PGPGW domain-containing protein [Polyangiaceae bacterium]|nr:PGPGW domain-containing protein [Polyangiaceae bacterium]